MRAHRKLWENALSEDWKYTPSRESLCWMVISITTHDEFMVMNNEDLADYSEEDQKLCQLFFALYFADEGFTIDTIEV